LWFSELEGIHSITLDGSQYLMDPKQHGGSSDMQSLNLSASCIPIVLLKGIQDTISSQHQSSATSARYAWTHHSVEVHKEAATVGPAVRKAANPACTISIKFLSSVEVAAPVIRGDPAKPTTG